MPKLKFEDWIHVLETAVIQLEYGYAPGEFAVFPHVWKPLFDEGLTPTQAFRRALDDHEKARREANEKKDANYQRIREHDAKFGV